MKRFRILFVGEMDYANTAARVARAINLLAGTQLARVFVHQPHPFGYQEDLVGAWNAPELQHLIDRLEPGNDWLIALGSGDWFRDLLYRGRVHQVARAVIHVGSDFRANPAEAARRDETFGFRVRLLNADLYRFAAEEPNVVPYVPPIDAFHTRSRPLSGQRPLLVAHTPSNPAVKGTDKIRLALTQLVADDEIELQVTKGVSFAEVIDRRADAQVYIDQITDDVAIGGFGAAATEAMSQRLAVIGDMRHVRASEAAIAPFFPLPPILHAEDSGNLVAAVETLIEDPGFLAELRGSSATWAMRWASPNAVARYWLQALWSRSGK